MNAITDTRLPVAVLGAGPVGLAAAAHLLARGMTPLILEAGTGVGHNLESYRHVRLFSPWRYNVDHAACALLLDAGWTAPAADALPTAGQLVDGYLRPLAALPALAASLKLGHRVLAVTRAGFDKVTTRGREHAPFVVRAATLKGECEFLASAVIDATGTWSQPNPLGADGVPALGETALRARIAYGMPDVLGAARARYAGRRVLVVGSGHSATGTLLALADLAEQVPGTELVWAIRRRQDARLFGGGAADGLAARGLLGVRLAALYRSGRLELREGFRIRMLEERAGAITVHADAGVPSIDGVGAIIAATGARPDLALTRELRVRHAPWLESSEPLAPLIDPNEHSCGTVPPHGHRQLTHPEPGYYAVGAKSYGRAPNFLLVTGYEQVRSVAAALAGDLAAADEVRLVLPQTGICRTDDAGAEVGAEMGAKASLGVSPTVGCCGGPAPAGTQGCCRLDAEARRPGEGGCWCTSASEPARTPAAALAAANPPCCI